MAETTVMTKPPAQPAPAEVIERAMGKGDLSQLTAEQRMQYMREVCDSLGLNPLTQPFSFLTDKKGKVVLYARKDCTDQLRRIHAVTLEIAGREVVDDLCIVHVRATMPAAGKGGHKRTDEDVGVVPLGKLTGEDRANAIMKAITKAKRRATLSICGLGMLDETEAETISVEARTIPSPQVVAPPAALPAPQPQPAAAPNLASTDAQADECRRLRALVGADIYRAELARFKVESVRAMTAGSADKLIEALRKLAAQLPQAAGVNGAAGAPRAATFRAEDPPF